MADYSVSLKKLIDQTGMEVTYAPDDLQKCIVKSAEVNRPGLFLAGYYEYFDATRIQILGLAEMNFLSEQSTAIRRTALEKLFSQKPSAVIISRSQELLPFPEMIEFAKKYKVPLLRSTEMTSTLLSNLIGILNTELAPRVTRHGVLVEVYGEGILIYGDSGIGKSETAIELVKRGHRLVADDAVELRKVSNRSIVGRAPENIRHFIELRGIGIINVARVYGVGAVKVSEKIDLVVQLEHWDQSKNYQRTGLETETTEILGVKIPCTAIPVMPGRNLAVILETAAINNRQKKMGYNAAQELLERLGLEGNPDLPM
ncbi:MAG: HPr(Ser) kinase/phosphatase [Faecalibacterium sp.]|nr:HPr(Ser) kinase/phosphatase [Faecalibacterium sp.]